MIVVDTSIWVSYFRGKDREIVDRLHELLDMQKVALVAPVWIEILSGAGKNEFQRVKRVMSALPQFFPNDQTWKLMEKWVAEATLVSQRFGSLDLLIAAIAKENDLAVWSLDQDFGRMQKLGWIQVWENL